MNPEPVAWMPTPETIAEANLTHFVRAAGRRDPLLLEEEAAMASAGVVARMVYPSGQQGADRSRRDVAGGTGAAVMLRVGPPPSGRRG